MKVAAGTKAYKKIAIFDFGVRHNGRVDKRRSSYRDKPEAVWKGEGCGFTCPILWY